jgi:hypothetical protein
MVAWTCCFGPVTMQYTMTSVVEELLTSMDGQEVKEQEKDTRVPQPPLQYTLTDLRPPSRPCLLKVPPPPNSITG